MEVSDVDALALIGGGLLVEAVLAAATCAAHGLFPFSFLPKSSVKFTSSRFLLAPIAHVYGIFSKCEGSGLSANLAKKWVTPASNQPGRFGA